MLYERTFPNEHAAHEVARREGFTHYEVVSRPEPIQDSGPIGFSMSIPNVRYFIVYTL